MKSIHVVPIGSIQEDVLNEISIGLWNVFGFEITLCPSLPHPDYAFDHHRKQYSSVMILSEMQKLYSPDMVKLLGVTEGDLFIPMLNFVFGHAQLHGIFAVISLARLKQQFYNLPENREVLLARAVKEAVHEIGHTFGLIHCSNRQCAMALSNTISLVDVKTDELCPTCSIILEQNTKHIVTINGMEKIK